MACAKCARRGVLVAPPSRTWESLLFVSEIFFLVGGRRWWKRCELCLQNLSRPSACGSSAVLPFLPPPPPNEAVINMTSCESVIARKRNRKLNRFFFLHRADDSKPDDGRQKIWPRLWTRKSTARGAASGAVFCSHLGASSTSVRFFIVLAKDMNRPVVSPVLQLDGPTPPFSQLSLHIPNCAPCRPLSCLATDPVHHRLAATS